MKSVTLEYNIKSFTNVNDIIETSGSISSFFENFKTFMTSENISKMEAQTRGRAKIIYGMHVEKVLYLLQKAPDVLTKMKKVIKGTDGYVNL